MPYGADYGSAYSGSTVEVTVSSTVEVTLCNTDVREAQKSAYWGYEKALH